MPAHRTPGDSLNARPAFAVTMGDPMGIGPEIIVKSILGPAASVWRSTVRLHLIASRHALVNAAAQCGLRGIEKLPTLAHDAAVPPDLADADIIIFDNPTDDSALGRTATPTHSSPGGAASFACVDDAIARALLARSDSRHIEAIITAPISKTSWNLAGHTRWPGHTELLAERFDAPDSGMLFVGPSMRVMLATIHVPLMQVRRELSIEKIVKAIRLSHAACVALGVKRSGGPRIAVCGLNPHAGEGGLLGADDAEVIAPAIALARAEGIDAIGPLPGDTAFGPAVIAPRGPGMYDCVVAMYHDQGLIPIKLLDGKHAVNVTVGLPTIRTSPAHGTAFDIAGQNLADETSMIAAIDLAIQLHESGRIVVR